jgi:hypothetical protein
VLIVSVLIVSVLIVSVLIVSVLIVSVLKGGDGGPGDLSDQKRRARKPFLFLQTQTEKAYAILRPPCSSRSR